jgi:Family of unknown function (DUF6353)
MILQSLAPHANKMKYLVNENSTTILTAMGVVGTVTTAVLTGKASFKAAKIIAANERTVILYDEDDSKIDKSVHLTSKEKIQLVWTQYIPPAASCAITIASIVVSHRVDAKKIAALTMSSAVTERAFQEYKDKITQKLGEKKAEEVRAEIAQDRVNKNPVEGSQVIMTGTGDVLCYDNLTGRYFTSSMEKLRGAENDINHQLLHRSYASLSEFFEIVGLGATTFTDSVGWCMDIPLNVQYSTTLSVDGRPCIAIDFEPMPKTGYEHMYE